MPKHPTIADFTTMVEAAPEAVIVYTPEKFLYLNAFAASRLGADAASLVGQPIMEFVHPSSISVVPRRLRDLMSGDTSGRPVEVSFVSKDGRVIPAETV